MRCRLFTLGMLVTFLEPGPGFADVDRDQAVEQAQQTSIEWLERSEVEMRQVTRISNDFPEEDWWPAVLRAFVDAGEHQAALAFARRWHRQFGQSFGREALRLMAIRLSGHGRFDEAKTMALILVEQNNPMLYGFSPSDNEQLCVVILTDIAGHQAAAGDLAAARETAGMIPRRRRASARANAFYQIALACARAGDAAGLEQHAAEFAGTQEYDNQDTRLLFAVELAMAGTVEDALELADTLPSSSRRTAFARISLAQAEEDDWTGAVETAERITTIEDRQLALLRLAAVRAWRGDLDAAAGLVEQQFEADEFSAHQHRYSCRHTLGAVRAWAGDFETAEQLLPQDRLNEIQTRLRLGRVLDYSDDEAAIRPWTDQMHHSRYACPTLLTRLHTTAFNDAVDEALPFLELVASGDEFQPDIVRFGDEARSNRPDDFDYLTSLYSVLGATCVVAGDEESAATFFDSALSVADETDFRNMENLPFLLGGLVRVGETRMALRHLQRIIHVCGESRQLSDIEAQVAFAMAETGAVAELEDLLAMAPRQADRALICVGAAHGFIAAGRENVDLPLPRDAYELLVRCHLRLPLPHVRGSVR